MLKSNTPNNTNDNLTTSSMVEVTVDLLVELTAYLKSPSTYLIDSKVFGEFGRISQMAQNIADPMNENYYLGRVISECKVTGTPISQFAQSSINPSTAAEMLVQLQKLYGDLKQYSSAVSSKSSFLLVG